LLYALDIMHAGRHGIVLAHHLQVAEHGPLKIKVPMAFAEPDSVHADGRGAGHQKVELPERPERGNADVHAEALGTIQRRRELS
jgi:hypothetical protein